MTPRFTQALALAARAHEGQQRKGTSIPYISHPVAVAALVARYGGDEDQQIAALLHDVLEDGGPQYAPEIEAGFGPRVLSIVRGCTDGEPDETGTKAPWRERKEAYLAHLSSAGPDVWMVSGCDKLSNAQAIVEDLTGVGQAVFERFTAGKVGTLWYYRSLADVFGVTGVPMAKSLTSTVEAMHALSA